MIRIPLIARALLHAQRTAVLDATGSHTYDQLLASSEHIASALLAEHEHLREKAVPFLVSPGAAWVSTQWGIWRAGGIAVPLPMGTPPVELDYIIQDTEAETLIADEMNLKLLEPIAVSRGLKLLSYEDAVQTAPITTLPSVNPDRAAMILYTSGTTSRPKGVVTTHANIGAQISCLIDAWQWTENDKIPLFLPLHHVHGIINVLSCAFWAGATCEILSRFDANVVWDHIEHGEFTLFMAVPTIYSKLTTAWESYSEERKNTLRNACSRMRLMVSGSAALPVATLNRWKEISTHTLLERYGMTEIGMALSNPYIGERVPGSVGIPLPTVYVRLVDEHGDELASEVPGEIEVKGPSVFREYWRSPEATQQAFHEGWFRTGDVAVVDHEYYRILGRMSVDIIKTGGHKVSALEVEELLREHPAIAECAVVGLPDDEWGERIAAAVVLKDNKSLAIDELRLWGKERLAAHKLPSRLLTMDTLPRNAMGKVIKRAVVNLFT